MQNTNVENQYPILAVIIPVFNEQECLGELMSRLTILRNQMSHKVCMEFIFVDDGSNDDSKKILTEFADRNQFTKVIALSRNFGHQIAVTAGIDFVECDYVAIIDADLQDPPEIIDNMYELLLEGFDVIYGQRRCREGEGLFKKISANIFYRILSYMCDISIPRNTGDFRIMTNRVCDQLKTMPEQHRFIRGMVPWVGFKSKPFLYNRDERFAGVTKYPLRKMLRFAFDAIFSFSKKPLIYATRVGVLSIILAFLGALYMLYVKLFTTISVPGITVVIITIVFMGGIQIFITGIIGQYVARIFEESKGRPLYVVDQLMNISKLN